uniref:Uncharacterized protein n=1 Tax=Histophilus somni (strain 129Pt) TaxID=205914 RepID=Q0I1A5_HISS1
MNHLDSAQETLSLYAQQIITLNHRFYEEFNRVMEMMIGNPYSTLVRLLLRAKLYSHWN